MAPAVYFLGLLTTALCAWLLARGYLRSRQRLLLWSSLCFAGLTVSHALLIIDLLVVPGIDLYASRLGVAAAAMAVLNFGLVWDSQ